MARTSLIPFRTGGLLGGDPFASLHREVNRLFDDVVRGTGLSVASAPAGGAVLAPRMNVSETDEEIRVTAELPGVSEQDIHVELRDDVLTIRAEKKEERREEKENFHFVERSFGTFQRSLELPFKIAPDQVRARFADGVLTVTLPKGAQQEQAHRIAVQSGGALEHRSSADASA